jgi:FkbM family methyltransferase
MIRFAKLVYRALFKPRLHAPEGAIDYAVLGTVYGGWPLVDSTPQKAILYSFGVGEDISFDLEAIRKFDCQVHAFDPTPRSLAWIEQQQLPVGMTFHSIGIASTDGEMTFYPPENDAYVSFSATPAPKADTSRAITAPVQRMKTIMSNLGHEKVDVLKMDIEGFEYDVIDDIIRSEVRPGQWLIEFHHRMYDITPEKTRQAVAKIKAHGYTLFYVSEGGHEYGFVLSDVAKTA